MPATADTSDPPQNPAGPSEARTYLDAPARQGLIAEIESLPSRLRSTVAGLDDGKLDVKYRNWTVRQIVHHLADSHANAYVRWRLALTEDRPTIKPYDESRWATLDDAARAPIEPSLALLDALHDRWTRLLRSLTEDQFSREYFHPEMNRHVRLDEALGSYAWHGRHHTAQIAWLRDRHGW